MSDGSIINKVNILLKAAAIEIKDLNRIRDSMKETLEILVVKVGSGYKRRSSRWKSIF